MQADEFDWNPIENILDPLVIRIFKLDARDRGQDFDSHRGKSHSNDLVILEKQLFNQHLAAEPEVFESCDNSSSILRV